MPKTSNPIHLLLVLLVINAAAVSALAQVEPEAEGGPVAHDDTQMLTPPPVSAMLYPAVAGAEERTNYLASSLVVDVAHVNNILPTFGGGPVTDTVYSFMPKALLDRTTSRQQISATYNPAFTFYEPTSVLDTVDQTAALSYQNHPTPYSAIVAQDFFSRTADVFDGSFPFSAGGLTGTAQAPSPAVIAPFAEQLTNNADVNMAYQFGRNAMAGVGGNYSLFNLPNPALALGLYNSNGGGGSAFYDHRFARTHYAGISYDYSRIWAGPDNGQVETQLHSILPFYTLYLSRTFSFSISAGTQRLGETQPQQPASNSWSPAGVVSMGWQGERGVISASYLHTIITGGGLVGAFNSDSVHGAGAWTFLRTWVAHAAVAYSSITATAPLVGIAYQGGNLLAASGSVTYDVSEHFTLEGGYERLHENYGGIAVIVQDPDSNRVFLTASYRFEKLLGR